MTLAIDRGRFIEEYRRAVPEVMRFVTHDHQELIARHNAGWHPDLHRFDAYLEASETRYLRVVDNFNRYRSRSSAAPSALDVGGFLGAFPLALARSGVNTTLVEEYGYYGDAFDGLARHLEEHGVTVWPVDFTLALERGPDDRFDLATAMAILEHLPSSPRELMGNVRRCLRGDGLAAVEVPNIAYWPNRMRALRGGSVHQPFELLYASVPPFTGHHREYTVAELKELFRWTGFRPLSVECFNYTVNLRAATGRDRLTMLAYLWPAFVFESFREVILAIATPTADLNSEPDIVSRLRAVEQQTTLAD
jgi:SAM-dependent methyltransferase